MVEFPLPQELKDEVYSYLLSPEAAINLTRARTHEKPDPHHDYEASILLVNKSIGQDAARYLRSQNSFVRIESDRFGLFSQLARLGAHIISTQIDDRCPHLAFSISVLSPEHYFVVEDRHFVGLEDRHFEGVDSVLILERDMDKFWTVLRMASHSELVDCVQIHRRPDGEYKFTASRHKRVASTVQFFANPNSRKRKADFLQFARDNGGGFMEITCLSETGEEWAIPSSAPVATLVWPLAFGRSRIDSLLAFKAKADSLVSAENCGKRCQSTATPHSTCEAGIGSNFTKLTQEQVLRATSRQDATLSNSTSSSLAYCSSSTSQGFHTAEDSPGPPDTTRTTIVSCSSMAAGLTYLRPRKTSLNTSFRSPDYWTLQKSRADSRCGMPSQQ